MATQQELNEMLDHVGYEWWMFQATYLQLMDIDLTGDVVLNALVESLAIHGRGLIGFFYQTQRRPGDITCEHYGMKRELMPEPGSVVRAWKDDADKRIAHITNTRLTRQLSWPTSDLCKVLEKKIDELRAQLGHPLPHDNSRQGTIHTLLRDPKAGVARAWYTPHSTSTPVSTDAGFVVRTSGTKSAG